jgi:hypothetical protein
MLLQELRLELLSGWKKQFMAKAIDDKDGTVREAALQCAGILKGRLGAPVMD